MGRTRWRKSSRSGGTNGDCIELAHTWDAVRDSKNPELTLAGDVSRLLETVRATRV